MPDIDEVARPVWQSLYLLSYFAGAQILLLSLVLCDPVIFHDSVPTHSFYCLLGKKTDTYSLFAETDQELFVF